MSIFQDVNVWLAVLNLLVAFLGIAFVMLAYFEWRSLRGTRKEFDDFERNLTSRQHKAQKAMQRVIASYGLQDPDQRIVLLRSAIAIDPTVFNGFNALGYAYLDKSDSTAALDAFRQAVQYHPQDKEGYFDLARAYLAMKPAREDLAKQYLLQAIQIDATSRDDIEQDAELREVMQSQAQS